MGTTGRVDPSLRRVLEALVDEAMAHVANGDAERAVQTLAEAAAIDADDPVLLLARGRLAADAGRHDEALRCLTAALVRRPDDAEAHYALGCLAEDAGDRAAMIEHFTAVRRLDAAADRRAGVGIPQDLRFVERAAEEVLRRLPSRFADPLAQVPVVLEARPSSALVREGLDPRAVGLFEGAEHGQPTDAVVPRPTRIVLFYANLLADCADDAELTEQVEVTLLHEIGHFFGLDEDGVAAIGLG